MDEVEIKVVQSELGEAFFQGRPDSCSAMPSAPQLRESTEIVEYNNIYIYIYIGIYILEYIYPIYIIYILE